MEVTGPWLLPFSCKFCSSTARMLLHQSVQHFLSPGAVRHGWQGWLPSPISASSLLGSPQGQCPAPKVVVAIRAGLSGQQPGRVGCSHILAFLESWGGISTVLARCYPTAAQAGKHIPPPASDLTLSCLQPPLTWTSRARKPPPPSCHGSSL